MEWRHTREVGTYTEKGYRTYTEKGHTWKGDTHGKGI